MDRPPANFPPHLYASGCHQHGAVQLLEHGEVQRGPERLCREGEHEAKRLQAVVQREPEGGGLAQVASNQGPGRKDDSPGKEDDTTINL